eukprot:g11253.t1
MFTAAAPVRKKRKAPPPKSDGERCSICLDEWTSKGKHRICTLLCGHLFGKSCIERWLKERRSCPQCGAKVGTKGSNRVIPLFVQNLVAKDTGELETARMFLEEEKRLRKQCEAERVRLSIENASLKDQLSRRSTSSTRENPNTNSSSGGAGRGSGSGGGGGGCDFNFAAGNLFAGGGSFAQRQRQGQRTGPPLPVSSPLTPLTGGRAVSSPSPSWVVRNAGSATVVAAGSAAGASPDATAYSQHVPSPGNFHDSMGGSISGDCDGGGERAAAAAAASNRVAKVAVRADDLLSRNVQAGRVVAFAGGATGALIVSQEFGERRPQHGVTKFSLADLRHRKNIHLHREQIRDIKFSVEGGSVSYMLSTGFDKTLKVCDLRTDSVVVSYDLEGNGWSCQWSATNPTQMFCGVVDGTRVSAVQLFDLRSTSGAVLKLRAAARQRQPIHSICHTAHDLLLCATMGGVWAWGGGTKVTGAGAGGGSGGGEEQAERLQIQAGPCCSLSGASSSSGSSGGGTVARQDRFLVSTRGSSASHAVFGVQGPLTVSAAADAAREGREQGGGAEKAVFRGDDGCRHREEKNGDQQARAIGHGAGAREEGLKWDGLPHQTRQNAFGDGTAVPEHQSWSKRWTRFPGVMQGHQSQQTLSRSLLWEPSPGAGLLIAGGDERTNQPWIWDASSGDVCSRLARHRSPVLDVGSLQDGSSGNGLFAAVSHGEINVYQTQVFDTR